jgi:beta-catenin-like protein 1
LFFIMASIDDLFKKPSIPSKRKLQVSHDPSSFYKSAKHDANGDVKGGSHASTVEDAPENNDDDDDDDDVEAGPAAPLPEADEGEDYGPDDDGGRFFGGGVDEGTKAAMDFVEKIDNEEEFVDEKYDLSWIRKLGLNFEKKISKNAELRAKYEDDPQKFMGSEADLDATIKNLSILSEHSGLYEEFAKLGCVSSLVSIVAHENADISIDAIEIINELVDEDVEASEEQWNAFVNAALDADLLNLLVQNFARLNESQETDGSGIYNSLAILESLASQSVLSERIGSNASILNWLLSRIQKLESPVTQNKQYAAEILAILVQSSTPNRIAIIDLDGVEIILQLLAPYRRRDPAKESDEEEFVENLFDTLTCLLDEPTGKTKFVEAEGVELVLIMVREGKLSKFRALRMLDHAMGSLLGGDVCSQVVEAQGLKTLFGLFMKKQDASTTEHLLGIFAALLRTLPGESAPRIRTLAKFAEKDYEKITKLVSLRREFGPRLVAVRQQIQGEMKGLDAPDQEMMEVEWFSRRMDAGLYTLQTLDMMLAWLAAEDSGMRSKITQLLGERDEGLADIKATLQEQVDGIVDTDDEAQFSKDMLRTLIGILG